MQCSQNTKQRAKLKVYCKTVLKYAKPNGHGAVPVDVTIYDGREETGLSFDRNGFELLKLKSNVTNWFDRDDIDKHHYDEIEAFAKSRTKCDWVLFYPAIIRSPQLAKDEVDLGPIKLAHSDYTDSYWSMISEPTHPYVEILRPSMERAQIDCSDIAKASRILTIQIWRNIGTQVPDYPLCLGDTRSFARSDLMPRLKPTYAGRKAGFRSFVLLSDGNIDQHQWFTFPMLDIDEVLLFRAYDSELVAKNIPYWTPHCAFRDVNAPEDASGRKSVETRIICGFR